MNEGLSSKPGKNQETTENKPAEAKTSLDAFRSKFMRAFLLGTSLMLFKACAPTEDEIAQMPQASVEKMAENMGAFAQLNLVRVNGHVEDMGEKKETSVGIEYNFLEEEWEVVTKTNITHHYKLHSRPDKNSPHIEIVKKEGEDHDGDFNTRHSKKIPMEFTYEVIGRVIPVAGGKHVLELAQGRHIDIELPPIKKEPLK